MANSHKPSAITDPKLKTLKPEHILSRMLSLNSALSINSSLAEPTRRAQDNTKRNPLPSIGAGQCGTIYALPDNTTVIKLPNSPPKADELFTELKNHIRVKSAFQDVPISLRKHVHVPALKKWVCPKSSCFWSRNANSFDLGITAPDYGLISERIFPVPQPVREALVDAFAPKAIKARKREFLSAAPDNTDCLVRLYLGRRNDDAPPVAAERFHLRNFPLYVNEMERLKLNTAFFAKLMAQALAILHWRAGLDANDVEFVFGSAPEFADSPLLEDVEGMDMDEAAAVFQDDFPHCRLSIWLLDLNLCQPFTLDDAGLKKLVDAFYWNDPYYPRPRFMAGSTKDNDLWDVFASCYLEVSAQFVEHDMPRKFIEAVVEVSRKRSGGGLFG